MKRLLTLFAICAMLLLNPIGSSEAYASPISALGLPPYLADATTAATPAASQDWLVQLENEIVPQIKDIFTPEQQVQFEDSIASGISFRKAFKSLTLTPSQKTQLKTLLASVSKKDALASLTPEQRQKFFMKKKELFMPTSDEIMDKIQTGMSGKGMDMPEGIKDKIDAAMSKKKSFMPSLGGK